MKKPKILITGATGKTGRAAALDLLERDYSVRVLAHRKDARSELLSNAGAEVVFGNLEDPMHVSRAMRGVHRAYFVCPWTPNQLDLALNFAVAAADHRLEHVVALSQWLSHPVHPSLATRRTYLVDRLLQWLPSATSTIINVGFFADNYMALLEPISQLGLMALPLGDGRNAPVSNEDIGRTAAWALTSPELHAGRTYRPTGPVLMSPEEIAEAFGRVLRRPVRYQNAPPKLFLKATRAMGMPTSLIAQLHHYFEEYRQGTFAAGAPSDAVLHVTGREAEPFETIVKRYVTGSQVTGLVPSLGRTADTRRTLGNALRAVSNLLMTLATPAPDLAGHELRWGYPDLEQSQYAMAAPLWREDHLVPNAFGAPQSGPIF